MEVELQSYPMIPCHLFSHLRRLPAEVAESVGCQSFFQTSEMLKGRAGISICTWNLSP